MAQIVRNCSLINTIFLLSWNPILWLGLQDKASDLSIDFLEWWYSLKLNLAGYNDHYTCLQLSFLATIKYSKFLWSAQILTEVFAHSKKCFYFLRVQIIANTFLL